MAKALRSELEQIERKQASQSILKALDLVDVMVKAPSPLTLNELSRAVKRPVPTVHRLLRTLGLRGWVENVDGRYRLTLKMFEIGMSVVDKIDVVAEARPECEALSREFDETVNMSVRSGTSAVYVIKIDSARSLRLISQLGVHVPLYCTAMGKVMLAYLEPDERARLLDQIKLEPRARNTITDRAALDKELIAIARRGWSIDNEEFDYGLVCIGAPVFNRSGGTAGAISLTGPIVRLPFTSWEEIGRRVRNCADSISRRLGYSVHKAPDLALTKARE